MKYRLFFLGVLVSIMLPSCATLFTGTKDEIKFDSNPQGAMVYIDGVEICRTPCTAQVKRKLHDAMAKLELEGYKTRVITLDAKFNTVSILNFFGLVGWGIDAATGALMRYDPKGYQIDLEKEHGLSSIDNPLKIEIDTDSQVVDVYVVEE